MKIRWIVAIAAGAVLALGAAAWLAAWIVGNLLAGVD
jgi:hypothetical protein